MQATEVHAQLVLLVNTAMLLLDGQLKMQPARAPVLLATRQQEQARLSLQTATDALPATEAPQ
jgi:hypothetical protein